MNQFAQKIKGNIIPFFVFSAFVAACGIAWFLYHPASPYHARYQFVVRFETIGTLSPGNRVQVRGITKGQILKVELTEDAVFVTVEVLADTKIALNSEFRLITAGLMGEREMCILSGDSTALVTPGDTVHGLFEEGASGISKGLGEIGDNLDFIISELTSLRDTFTVGSIGQAIDRIPQKGRFLVATGEGKVNGFQEQVGGTIDHAKTVIENLKGTLEKTKNQAGDLMNDAEQLIVRADTLIEGLSKLKESATAVTGKLNQDNNSAGLLASPESPFFKEASLIASDFDIMINDVKKYSLKLNVDIF